METWHVTYASCAPRDAVLNAQQIELRPQGLYLMETGDHVFISGAVLPREDEKACDVVAGAPKQATIGAFFNTMPVNRFEVKKRERAPVSSKECYK